MVKLTILTRTTDALPLAEGLENDREIDLEQQKTQAKKLMKQLFQERQQSQRISITSGKLSFHVLIEGIVCYLTLADKNYPKKLAFQYLEELHNEFVRLYGTQIETVARPYAFIKFDTFIQKTRKLYLDTRTQRNMAKLNEELSEVHQIMTKSINEMLGQGERLDYMSKLSNTLAQESKGYAKRTDSLLRQAYIRKYMPVAVVVLVLIVLLYFRSWFAR